MSRIIKVINRIEEWTLVLVLLGLAFLTFVQVVCRYLFNFSFTWQEEVARYLGVFVTFLGASLGIKYGTHFSMDLLFERVSNDRFRHGLKIVIYVVSTVVFLVIAYYGWEQTMKLRQFTARTSVLQIPKYLVYLPIPFFSLIMAWRLASLGWKHVTAFLKNQPFGADNRAP
jgi:C4-dicarboxylate transporter DctQ subunit